MKAPVTRLAYGQELLLSQSTDTLTHGADHGEQFRHDASTRYLRGERSTPRLVWDKGRAQVVPTPPGDVVFEDPGLYKHAAQAIDLGRRPSSGNATAVINGMGTVPCGDVTAHREQFWWIDYRRDDPDGDGKSTLDQVRDRLLNGVYPPPLPWAAVRLDPWDATPALLLRIDAMQNRDSCPLPDNRHVDEASGSQPYQRVAALPWNATALAQGKTLKINGCPTAPQGRLCRVEVATHRTDGVVTPAPTQASTAATPQAGGFRWQLEPLHRPGKHVTGLDRGQCRKARSQRKHLGWAFLVGVRLKAWAGQTGRTLYQLKHGLLDKDLIEPLNTPALKMVLA